VDYIKLINMLSTLNKEAIKLLNLIKKVYLFEIRGERTLLIDLLYNLALSNLKKFKKSLKLILVNLL